MHNFNGGDAVSKCRGASPLLNPYTGDHRRCCNTCMLPKTCNRYFNVPPCSEIVLVPASTLNQLQQWLETCTHASLGILQTFFRNSEVLTLFSLVDWRAVSDAVAFERCSSPLYGIGSNQVASDKQAIKMITSYPWHWAESSCE
ncbi:uncharacterized protein [Physcomitrium patens]|uniref:uncharacterized protein n=1 Tax=Physcomitrium patens TaxID=3218 RepID=UPI003CCD7AAB